MSDETKIIGDTEETTVATEAIEVAEAPVADVPVPAAPMAPVAAADKQFTPDMRDKRGARGGARGGPRRGRKDRRDDRPKSEFDHRLITIRRVSRTVAGGRRFSFSAIVAVGNRKGMVGIGQGKAGDTPIAIEKAVRNAKKHLMTVELTKAMRIPHETSAKYSSARVKIMPAPGRGILAGSATRIVLELAGIKEVNAKILSGSKNALNISKATLKALSLLSGAQRVSKK